MKAKTHFYVLAVAALAAYGATWIFELFAHPKGLVHGGVLLLVKVAFSAALASLVLKRTSFKRLIWVVVGACFLAPSLQKLILLPAIWYQASWVIGLVLSCVAFVAAFYLSDLVFNKLHMRMRYKVAIAGVLIVTLGILVSVLGLYVERATARRVLAPTEEYYSPQ